MTTTTGTPTTQGIPVTTIVPAAENSIRMLLPHTWLQDIFFRHFRSSFSNPPVNTENSSNGNIDINVATSIQGIKEHHIFGVLTHFIIKSYEFIQFLTGNTGTTNTVLQYAHKLIIGIDVQFLYIFSLNIDGTGIS